MQSVRGSGVRLSTVALAALPVLGAQWVFRKDVLTLGSTVCSGGSGSRRSDGDCLCSLWLFPGEQPWVRKQPTSGLIQEQWKVRHPTFEGGKFQELWHIHSLFPGRGHGVGREPRPPL